MTDEWPVMSKTGTRSWRGTRRKGVARRVKPFKNVTVGGVVAPFEM
ncbi:MAG TPA: hypothetical protein VNF02_05910 [Candidatus Limnocylindrales bacterium]|nr:hypothetical protein [Candidatus Limnocylindrales bacterium]